MSGLELSHPMRVLVEEISGIGSDDSVVIITDDTRRTVSDALACATRAAGATTVITILPYENRGGIEPPSMAMAIMKNADYAFILTSNNLTHTDAHREAQAAGTQISSMWGTSEDTFLNGPSPENYREIDRLTGAVKGKLEETDQIAITSPAGTNLTFEVSDRPAIALGVKENDKSTVADFPVGEVAIAPIEGTAEGTVVADIGFDVFGLVETPIELEFAGGHVRSIDGGSTARELQRMIDSADNTATNLAEFAIGTNPDARLVDHIRETKKKLGTVHIAIGDSRSIGGTVTSDLHLDAILAAPTVLFDGEVIMEEGDLLTVL